MPLFCCIPARPPLPTSLPHRPILLPLALQTPVIASNRIGTETFENSHITFYGGSFIAGPSGEIVAQVGIGRVLRVGG